MRRREKHKARRKQKSGAQKRRERSDRTSPIDERNLFSRLVSHYGYLLADAPKGKRVSMTTSRDAAGKLVIAPSYAVILYVPEAGYLGRLLAERYKQTKPPTVKDRKR